MSTEHDAARSKTLDAGIVRSWLDDAYEPHSKAHAALSRLVEETRRLRAERDQARARIDVLLEGTRRQARGAASAAHHCEQAEGEVTRLRAERDEARLWLRKWQVDFSEYVSEGEPDFTVWARQVPVKNAICEHCSETRFHLGHCVVAVASRGDEPPTLPPGYRPLDRLKATFCRMEGSAFQHKDRADAAEAELAQYKHDYWNAKREWAEAQERAIAAEGEATRLRAELGTTRSALLSVDSMLTAGNSRGSIRVFIEAALRTISTARLSGGSGGAKENEQRTESGDGTAVSEGVKST